MFSFFKKKPPITVRVKEAEALRYVAGLQTLTSKSTFKKEISALQGAFYEKRDRLLQRSAPSGTMVISCKPDEKGRFSYFVGDLVDTDQQESCFTVVTLEPGDYAYITVDFKVQNDLILSVAKAKLHFFEKWLPNSGYELRDDMESIELYDRRSKIKLPSIELIFPLRKK